ncbi:unnamed protein product [Urochloa decumbens]|uniref:Uncharacterized protein n=1 Tax=Urochloa decumbens TaxID=240449 RepID=A0ABC9AV71_9POAL
MAAGRTCLRRRGRIRRRCGGSKLGGRSGGNDDLVLKPSDHGDHSSCGEWISVRGHRIRLQGRMRVDANGHVYVPDSEDEEPGMEVEAGAVEVADLGGLNAAADAMQMAAVGVPLDAITVAAKGGDADGIKAAADTSTSDKLHPEVVARLKMVLPRIDPTFRDIFISMLKLKSINIEIYSTHSIMFIFFEAMDFILQDVDFIFFLIWWFFI